MSITKKLALRHLKQNKTRSVLTVLGITISVVMLTVIFYMCHIICTLLRRKSNQHKRQLAFLC